MISLSASIDGRVAPGLSGPTSKYRARSPFFSYRLPSDSLLSLGFGTTFPKGTRPPPPGAVSDGVYLLLAPLPAGTHVVHWTANAGPGGVFDVTYRLTVR